jgi:hypothetical protein
MTLYIRDRTPADDAWDVRALSELWGSPFVVSRCRGHPPVESYRMTQRSELSCWFL